MISSSTTMSSFDQKITSELLSKDVDTQPLILGFLFFAVLLICIFIFCLDLVLCESCRKRKEKQRDIEDPRLAKPIVFSLSPSIIV